VAGYALLTGADEKARSDASKRCAWSSAIRKSPSTVAASRQDHRQRLPDLQRQNLTPLEEAAASTKLIHKGATIDDVGRDLCPIASHPDRLPCRPPLDGSGALGRRGQSALSGALKVIVAD
jgi:hypothetical protein